MKQSGKIMLSELSEDEVSFNRAVLQSTFFVSWHTAETEMLSAVITEGTPVTC